MVVRTAILTAMNAALRRSPVVVLTGPRQCGKTTLARELLRPDSVNYFDLEDPASLVRLDEPMTALRPLQGLVVIDEVQRRPDLFPVLRVLADRRPQPARFLILGSASGDLLRQASESLAGRAERIVIDGFSLEEVGAAALDDLWRRGGFPVSYLAATEDDSLVWRGQFIMALLERDLPQWGVRVPAEALRRFWTIVAHSTSIRLRSWCCGRGRRGCWSSCETRAAWRLPRSGRRWACRGRALWTFCGP